MFSLAGFHVFPFMHSFRCPYTQRPNCTCTVWEMRFKKSSLFRVDVVWLPAAVYRRNASCDTNQEYSIVCTACGQDKPRDLSPGATGMLYEIWRILFCLCHGRHSPEPHASSRRQHTTLTACNDIFCTCHVCEMRFKKSSLLGCT